MIAVPNEVEIVVRDTCGTYVATARASSTAGAARASSTAGAAQAARSCADKVYGLGNYSLEQTGVSRRVARSVWLAVAHDGLPAAGVRHDPARAAGPRDHHAG